ncbi:MAG: hypothetical protein ACUVWP_04605 [bacterium]
MPEVDIRDMDEKSEYFVSTCSHIDETEEHDACGMRRANWIKKMLKYGLSVKVALLDDRHVGLIYIIPIEVCPWGPIGKDLMVVPCLFVLNKNNGLGIGKALIAEAEEEAKRQGRKGVITIAYYHDFWFMPARFFEGCGYKNIGRRKTEALLWKIFDKSIEVPRFLEPKYNYQPVEGKVVIDLFYNTFCQTSDIEAQRVREVAFEFGDRVILNEQCADDMNTLHKYQISRGIFINGKEIWWGYEAPKEGIREAIEKAMGNKK